MPGIARLYVLGCFDSRITFYSQQVRALELVWALADQKYLQDNFHIAVVGGGAAGVTAAATLALLSKAHIDLFERAGELMPLQSASKRRHLDPHIYAWPAPNTDDPLAGLPILDWEKGSAHDVRKAVEGQFQGLHHKFKDRVQVRKRHLVSAATITGGRFQLTYERDKDAADPAGSPQRIVEQGDYDMVIIAVGFGLEPDNAIAGTLTKSYWSDESVPAAEFAGRTNPRFLISGNGDGALIDLVACASADFDHAGMIDTIANHPGVKSLAPEIEAIEADARAANKAGAHFDFETAYKAIDPKLSSIVAVVAKRLRPGVDIVLQTRHDEIFPVTTSALNRLAAHLVIRACKADPKAAFRHVVCQDVIFRANPPDNPHYAAPLWFDCDDKVVGADAVVVRRGPDRKSARAPFASLLELYPDHHQAWLERWGEATIAPALSQAARSAIAAAASEHSLPRAPHVSKALTALQPVRILIRPGAAENAHWSGDFAPQDAAKAWAKGAPLLHVFCPAAPNELGKLAAGVVRLALHAESAKLFADPADWRAFTTALTSASRHANHLALPQMECGAPAGAQHNLLTSGRDQLADALDSALNTFSLKAIDVRLRDYFASGRDEGHAIGFPSAADLRAAMSTLWDAWLKAFNADSALLGRFLQLMVCAADSDETIAEALVLVGPKKVESLTRASAVALATGVGWQDMSPRGARPGNLSRQQAKGDPWTGHACGADRIDAAPAALGAGRFMWRTHFVLLPGLHTPVDLSVQAGESLNKVALTQPRLDEADAPPSILLTLDSAFMTAAAAGKAAVSQLLAKVEASHFDRLKKND